MRSMDDLLLHLVFLAQNFRSFSNRHMVEIFLIEIGVPTRADGFRYLVDAVLIHESTEYAMVTKNIYPDIATHYGVTTQAISKSIERAINSTWKNRDEKWNMFFLSDCKPTGAEFISRIATILGFWQDCCKSVSQEEGTQCKG